MRATIPLILSPVLFAAVDEFGLPSCSASDQELATRSAFVLCHSSSLRVPLWTAYEMKSGPSPSPAARPKRFRRDDSLRLAGATDADYRNSGYSRGHMVPAADVSGTEDALRESFLLSNAVPQNGSLNSGKWRVLEQAVRRLGSTGASAVVFTGPIFCANIERIGANDVAVPCQLFKVVIANRGSKLEAFAAILPNDRNPEEPLSKFACPVSEVERRTGLDFFDRLPADVQLTLETATNRLPVAAH